MFTDISIDSAVVLAAGEGQRLRPLTKYRPKPMLPAANRPILEYVFDALIDAGVNDIQNVRALVKGEAVSTGRRKFGVVCGDGVKTGIQTSLNARVKLSSGARTGPAERVLRDPRSNQ